MAYQVEVRQVAARPLVATRGRASLAELPTKIPAKLGEVWNFIRSAGVKHDGKNVVIYWDDIDKALLMTPAGVPIDFGVGVLAPFTPSGDVISTATPAGMAATTLHTGPYAQLGDAHVAIRNWCKANGRSMVGTTWEIYGHWNSDPSKLETEVFYLLR